MQLHEFPQSAWCRRVTIYLAEKGVDVPRIPVNIHEGEQKSAAFLKMNPAGRVPVLEPDNGTYLTESGAIVEYLEELYPDPPMIGTDPETRARIRALDCLSTEAFWHMTTYAVHTHPYFKTRPGRPVMQKADVARYSLDVLASILPALNASLHHAPFLGSETPMIADCTLFAGAFTALRFGYQFPENMPSLSNWYKQFSARP